MKKTLLTLILFPLSLSVVQAGDWPQFRADAARSGYTSEPISINLSLQWVYKASAPPEPAWKGEDTRMSFDYAYHAIIAEKTVFFASSSDNQVYALDVSTGRRKWIFFTDSPIRFAPAYYQGRLYISGDDGYLYCLVAKTGAFLWKRKGGPAADMLLGNGRMISRWPTRGAVTILEDTLYYSAGIWPSEGIYIYALNPKTGDVLWQNDSSGVILMDQPHPGARARSGVSSQGYLAASGNTLLVPTGRAIPAAFNRSDGTFRYFHLQKYGKTRPSPFVTIMDDMTINRDEIFRVSDGHFICPGIPGSAVAAFPDWIVFAQNNEIKAIDRSKFLVEKRIKDKQGKVKSKIDLRSPSWSIACPESLAVSLIGAGQTILAGTKNQKIIAADIKTQSVVTIAEVDGAPLGLAAAGGYLIVSTDRGSIYCFADVAAESPREIMPDRESSPYGRNELYAVAAKEIIQKTGITKGYCLDLGCGEGQLAYELAQCTNLNIYALESDPQKVQKARELLYKAGIYGSRVTVLQRNLYDTKLPNYFANLIVSGNTIANAAAELPLQEITRLQRPYGGVVCLGQAGQMRKTVKGPLDNAGNWTHQYCNPANSNCSADQLVRAPFEMLWFIDNDYEMPSRHGRGPAPLFHDGRLFVEGLHGLRALDAYNGHVLWEYTLTNILKAYDQEHLMGTSGTGSNFCVTQEGLFIRTAQKCLQLDPVTGKLQKTFDPPPPPERSDRIWGYIACLDGILFGTLSDTKHIVKYPYGRSDMDTQFTESTLFFTLDVKTKELLWTYTPEYSIRNNAIAIGNGHVYLIDRPLSVYDRPDKNKKQTKNGSEVKDAASGILLALNMKTGKESWRVKENIYGTMLVLSEPHDALLMAFQDTRFKLLSELGGKMAAFRASDGKPLWDVKALYASRPVLNGRTIYAQPGAWDLLTGEKKDFQLERSYGCGILTGSRNLLAFRSATLGYRDLTTEAGTENYGGIRPGCWINAIPAGGLLLLPEASNRCTCSYLLKATIALQPIP